jgi:hypothetical protein
VACGENTVITSQADVQIKWVDVYTVCVFF